MIEATFEVDMKAAKKGIGSILKAGESMAKSNSGKLAATCRKIARNSMRKAIKLSKKMQREIKAMGAGTVSLPGNPPLERTGPLKAFLIYAWDEKQKKYVIGPKRLPRTGLQARSLEFGVPTISSVLDASGKNRVVAKIPIKARPFMAPAMAKTMTPANVRRAYEKTFNKAFKKALS